MSKRVEAQTGNISINPITGVVELYNADVQVVETTTTGSGGLLVDKGAGLEQVALLSEITGAITTSTPLSLEADIVTATPPTNEAVTDILTFVDNDSTDTLGFLGYLAVNPGELYLANQMQGSNLVLSAENTAGSATFEVTLDPDTESLILPLSTDNATPTLAFGDGDSGFHEDTDDQIRVSLQANDRWIFDINFFGTLNTARPAFRNVNPSGTNPDIIPTQTDTDTGIGWNSADQLSLIAGAKEMLRLVETGTATTDQVIIGPAGIIGAEATPALAFGDGNTGFFESADNVLNVSVEGAARHQFNGNFIRSNNAAGYGLLNEATSNTNPVVLPNNADADTGLGQNAVDQLSLIAGSVEMLRLVETGTAGTDQVIISPGATLRGAAATPLLAFGDGDSGFYETLDDILSLSLAGTQTWNFASGSFEGNATDAAALLNSGATATVPTVVPIKTDTNTGIGSAAADQLSLVAGGAELMRLVEDTEDYILSNTPVLISQSATAVADVTDYGQIWVRSDAPNVLMYTDDLGNDFTANNVLEIEYTYSSATAIADPGNGTLRFDTVTIGSITEMYIDDVDNTGRDNSIMLANLAVGDLVTFRSATDPADYIVATVDAATTDNTGYWTIPLAPVHVGTIFTNGDLLRMSVEWQSQAIAGSGNIGGSITDNQIAVGAATANNIEGDANLTWSGTALTIAGASAQLIVPSNDTPAAPALAFGDGDTGFYENNDDILRLSIGTTPLYQFTTTHISGVTSASFYLRNTTVTATNPSLGPRRDTNTGIGSAANDSMSLIAGGTEHMRFDATVGGQDHIKVEVPLYLDQRTVALNDYANYGQIWVQTDTPNRLMFTDDTGQDIRISPYRATVQTTDATLTPIIDVPVATDTAFGFRINIIGIHDTAVTGDTVFESIFGAIRNIGGTTALVGSTITDRTDDAGATTWVITVSADNTGNNLAVEVTGEAAHTIDWKVNVEILDV